MIARKLTTTLRERATELVNQHGGVRRAARALGLDAAYFLRLLRGEKDNPSAAVLRKMGLKRVVTYWRIE